MGKIKQYVTLLLAVVMAVTLLPMTAMATELPALEGPLIEERLAEHPYEPEETAIEEALSESAQAPEEAVIAEDLPESAEEPAITEEAAESEEEPEITEDTAEYAEEPDGEVQLTEAGRPYYYKVVDGTAHIQTFYGIVTDLVIPDTLDGYPVTGIEARVFQNRSFNSVTLPASLKTIGESAFENCSISELTIQEGLISIGDKAFAYNKQLKKLTIPSTVESIGERAFYSNTALASITLKNGLKSIGGQAFAGCAIKNLTIPASLETLGAGAFGGCKKLISFKIEEGATAAVSKGAFSGCQKLTSFSIPSGVTEIGESAFSGCSSLENVEIPAGVTKIGEFAFYSCSNLKNVLISSGVESIGNRVFQSCFELSSLRVDTENPNYDSRNDCSAIIETQTNTLIAGCKNTQIPDDVTTIGYYAFGECSCPSVIRLPSSVTTIKGYAFYGCKDLTKFVFSTTAVTIRSCAFWDCSNLAGTLSLPSGITLDGYDIFYGCIGLQKILLPDTLTSIPNGAFAYTGIKTIDIPESVTAIGSSAFKCCSSLTAVKIPSGVTYVPYHAFGNCTNLESVEIPEGVASIDYEAFVHSEKLTSINLPSTLRAIGEHAFSCPNLKDIYYNGGEKQWKTIESYRGGGDDYRLKGFTGTFPYGFPEDATFHYKSIPVPETLELGAASRIDLMPQDLPDGIAPEDIGWESDNTEAAVVESNGRVRGIARGSAVVTAYVKEDPSIKGSCKIKVLFADATHENVTAGIFKAIYWVADKKITGEKVYFGTNNTITRGQFVRFLYRYAGSPKVTNTRNPFKDVDSSYTHYKAILWAVGKGLIGGYTINGKQYFKPNEAVDRYSVATVLWKLAGSPKVKNAEKPFKDVAKSTPIAWGSEKGIIKGYSDGTFRPKANSKRGDFALILYRYNKYAGKK